MSESAEQRFYRLVGDKIRRTRKDHGWTQRDFANRCRLSVGFLSDVENGKRGMSAVHLVRMCDELGESVSYIIKSAGVRAT